MFKATVWTESFQTSILRVSHREQTFGQAALTEDTHTFGSGIFNSACFAQAATAHDSGKRLGVAAELDPGVLNAQPDP